MSESCHRDNCACKKCGQCDRFAHNIDEHIKKAHDGLYACVRGCGKRFATKQKMKKCNCGRMQHGDAHVEQLVQDAINEWWSDQH